MFTVSVYQADVSDHYYSNNNNLHTLDVYGWEHLTTS